MDMSDQGLNDGQRATFEREGYLVLPQLLTDEDMRPIVRALERKVDEIAGRLVQKRLIPHALTEATFRYRLARLFEHLDEADFLSFGRSWRDPEPEYFEFMSNPKLVDIAESLVGPDIFVNPVYNVRPKVPRVSSGAVPWHQDKSYWPGASSSPVITIWVALVNADEENGCLHVLPRTQGNPVLEHVAEKDSTSGYTELPRHLTELLNDGRAVALPVRAGSAVVFNDTFVHCSSPNRSDHVRWSVDIRYQPAGQDKMAAHGPGFVVRSRTGSFPLDDEHTWLAAARAVNDVRVEKHLERLAVTGSRVF